ncbi:hypothetical protein GCM10022402_09610 [Salinactinospora qingdaonensis]|uniref:Chaplin domain-containing protein n=2 Tax=Salinactinospora qingdaonensis TaxID=702744 RepID=A0ABP7F3Y7_9ACTN
MAPAAFADQETDGSGGVASGNQVNVPVDIVADLCGNSLAVLGISNAECTKVAKILYANSDKSGGQETDGSGGIASGNQINIPIDIALDLCGNSAAVGGLSNAKCTKVVKKIAESEENSQETDGSGGVASGNQINIPIDIALDLCGNSLSILGVSNAECTKVIKALQENPDNEGGGQETDGSGGVASGNQVDIPVDAATEICGNAVSVLGTSNSECLEQISYEEPEDGDDSNDDGGEGDDGGNEGEEPEGEKSPSPQPSDDGTDEQKNEDGDSEGEGDDSESPSPTPVADESTTEGGGLPVTGAALGGLVAAGVAALGGGGAAMYFSRKKRAAAASPSAEA